MSKMLTMACIVAGLLTVTVAVPLTGAQDAPQKKTGETRPKIAGGDTFAPGETETNIANLLLSRAVQKEIGITHEQVRKIAALWDQNFKRIYPLMMELRANSRNPEVRDKIQATLLAMAKDFRREIRTHLSLAQSRRLTQIAMQHAGVRAFLLPEVAEALNLDPETQEVIWEIIAAMEARQKELEDEVLRTDLKETPALPEEWVTYRKSAPYLSRHERYRRAIESNRAAGRREVLRQLTTRQRKTFDGLLGEPFDLEKYRKADVEEQRAQAQKER